MIPITLVPALIVSGLLTAVVIYLMWDIRRQERRGRH
jgi:hypothetical protein